MEVKILQFRLCEQHKQKVTCEEEMNLFYNNRDRPLDFFALKNDVNIT